MYTVMIAASAAGAGRTTLTIGLALHTQAVEQGFVVSLDAESQPILLQWAQRQNFRQPITAAWDNSCTSENLARLAEEGVDLVLVDCPLLEETERINGILECADLVVILVRPESEDLDAVGPLIDFVEAEGKPFIFVINQSADDEDMTTVTVMALAQHGTVSPVIVPHCAALAGLEPRGDAIVALDRLDYAAEMEPLWGYLRDILARHGELEDAALPDDIDVVGEENRQRYRQHATYIVPEMVYPCEVMEISAEGLLFTSEVALAEGTRLYFNLPYLGQLNCEVVANRPEGVEERFVIDEQRRAELYGQVADLVSSSRELPLSA